MVSHSSFLFINMLTKRAELHTTMTSLALAWVAKNPNTSTVILGATSPKQLLENLKALEVIPKLTPDILEKIEKILDNKPADYVSYLSLGCMFVHFLKQCFDSTSLYGEDIASILRVDSRSSVLDKYSSIASINFEQLAHQRWIPKRNILCGASIRKSFSG